MPEGLVPSPLGSRQSIIDGIVDVISTADFSDQTWGRIDTDDWSVEVSNRDDDPCMRFLLDVRGVREAIGTVAAILERLGLQALDNSESGIFSAGKASIASLRKLRDYRNEIVVDGDR